MKERTPAQEAAYQRGRDDYGSGRSDFHRRGMPTIDGQRQAYMDGRFAAAADRRKKLRDAGD